MPGSSASRPSCLSFTDTVHRLRLLGAGFSDFLLQLLADVAHALLLIRIGLAQPAHFGGNLSDLLAVDAGEREARILRVHGNRDIARDRVLDRVGIAEREHDGAFALQLRLITDADD